MKHKDMFVYISGPITPKGGRTLGENIRAATGVYYDLLSIGVPAFCPHLSALDPDSFDALTYDEWIAYDLAVIDRCTHLCMLDGWQDSAGAKIEYMRAAEIGIPAVGYDELVGIINGKETPNAKI